MNLVIAGGGVKAYAAIGILRELEKDYVFDKVIGVSAGSIVASLYVLGCDSHCIEKLYEEVEMKWESNVFFCISKILYRKGIHSTEEFKNNIVHKLLERACNNGDITFKEIFEKYNKILVIPGSCVNKQETHYYHYVSNPGMKVKDAIAISCSIPILFTPVIWNCDVLVDGGLIENYPLYFFDDDNTLPNSRLQKIEYTGSETNDNTVGIRFVDKIDYADNLIGYMKCLLSTALTNNTTRSGYWKRTIVVDTGDINAVSVLTPEDKKFLIRRGIESAVEFKRIN